MTHLQENISKVLTFLNTNHKTGYSYTELSNLLHLSRSTIVSIIRKLTRAGVIKKGVYLLKNIKDDKQLTAYVTVLRPYTPEEITVILQKILEMKGGEDK